MAAKRPSNPLALAVLTLLYERPMHPYQMSTMLKERAKEQSIKLNFGSLYSVVESLHKSGYVSDHATIRDGRRPERTVYAITEAGSTLMKEWLRDLLATPVKEFPQFEAALSLMPGLPPEEVAQLLEQRLATQTEAAAHARRFMDQAYGHGMPRLFAIEHEYELALLKAEVEFLTELVSELREERMEGLAFWRRVHEMRADGRTADEIEAMLREQLPGGDSWVEKVRNNTDM